MSYDRDKVEQVGPKKETGLRHPLKRFKPEVQLSRREKK